MSVKILIMGLPGSGKTTLATVLAPMLGAVHLNADAVRANINKDLGFSVEDRLEHARRMGWLADQVAKAGVHVIADFVCPTTETRAAFGPALTVFVDRIGAGRFADTNALFERPAHVEVRVTAEGTPQEWAERVAALVRR
jgi:adenylylsulfate kinase